MNVFIKKFLIATIGLTLASAPLAASAAPWGGHGSGGGHAAPVAHGGYGGGYRGGYTGGYHGGYAGGGYRGGYAPVYRGGYGYGGGFGVGIGFGGPAYRDGYYGYAPAGFYGYYANGYWYHHRRWGNGIWIYF